MSKLNSFWREMQLQMFLGTNTECYECGKTFLANEDGCPTCGINARVHSTIPPLNLSDCKIDESPNGYCFVVDKDGIYIVGNYQFSPWPREEK